MSYGEVFLRKLYQSAELTALVKEVYLPKDPLGVFFNHFPRTAGIVVHVASHSCSPLFLHMSFLSFDIGQHVFFKAR